MKHILLLAALTVFLFTGCSRVDPGIGEEAVLTTKPLIFGHGGIEPKPIKTGMSYVALTTDKVIVNMQPTQFPMHFEDLQSAEGIPLDFDSVIRLQVTDSVGLIEKFGARWYENNIQAEYANRVRQAVRKHGMNETAISTKAIDDIDSEVTAAMDAYLKSIKMPVNLIQVTVGKANPPDSIKNQRVETAKQEQRVQTETKRAAAEDSRLRAEESRAKADNAFRNAMQMSPEQYLRLEQIKMQQAVCASGKCTMIITDNKTTPLVNVH